MVRDSGLGKRISRHDRVDTGTGDYWRVWQENNGSRAPIRGSHGNRFPGIKLINCAQKTLTGHLGDYCNMVIMDATSKVLCTLIEKPDSPFSPPERSTEHILPPVMKAWRCNWDVIWPDKKYRPTFDKRKNQIICPPHSVDKAAVENTAYFRMFSAISSPGTFIFNVQVRDVTGAIAEWCRARATSGGDRRQTPLRFCIGIEPVSGATTAFALWDTEPVTFTGAFTVEDERKDITLSIHTHFAGMGAIAGGVTQEKEHRLEIINAGLWKLPLGE